MQVEVTILLSFVSLCVAGVVAVTSIRRNKATDDKKEASDMTTLIVKLENIGNGVNEIKSDMRNMREDMQDYGVRLRQSGWAFFASALVGGNWNNAGKCGARYVHLSNLASNTNANIGSRQSY